MWVVPVKQIAITHPTHDPPHAQSGMPAGHANRTTCRQTGLSTKGRCSSAAWRYRPRHSNSQPTTAQREPMRQQRPGVAAPSAGPVGREATARTNACCIPVSNQKDGLPLTPHPTCPDPSRTNTSRRHTCTTPVPATLPQARQRKKTCACAVSEQHATAAHLPQSPARLLNPQHPRGPQRLGRHSACTASQAGHAAPPA